MTGRYQFDTHPTGIGLMKFPSKATVKTVFPPYLFLEKCRIWRFLMIQWWSKMKGKIILEKQEGVIWHVSKLLYKFHTNLASGTLSRLYLSSKSLAGGLEDMEVPENLRMVSDHWEHDQYLRHLHRTKLVIFIGKKVTCKLTNKLTHNSGFIRKIVIL